MKQFFYCLMIIGFPISMVAQEKSLLEGDLSNESFYLDFSVYSIGTPIDAQVLKAEFIKAFSDLKLLTSHPAEISEKAIRYTHYNNAQKDYAPYDLEYLKYFGKGLGDRQKQMLVKSNQASQFLLYGLKKDVWNINKRMVEWLGEICKDKDWIIYDGETREYFSPQQWTAERIQTWTAEIPYLPNNIVVHSYREEEFCRCITLGMQKFGLPDIVINNASCYSIDDHLKLINVITQTLTTKSSIYKGQLLIDLAKIPNKQLRTEMLSSVHENAKKKIILSVKEGQHEDGDPFNMLLEIDFDNKNYESPQFYQEQILADLFGFSEPVYSVTHNEEIQKASNEARAKLPELQKLFNKGMDQNTILLKAPFEDDEGGTEWMWVEVTNWKTTKIKGLLQNEPFNIKTLKAGATVIVNQEDIFDYIHYLPDGSTEGNKTTELIMKYQE